MSTARARLASAGVRLPVWAVVAAVATGLSALSLLRRQPLSWDEAVTVAMAVRPVAAITTTLHHTDAVLGPYYLLVHGWAAALQLVGPTPTEIWWRVPSAAAAVAGCAVTASWADRVAGRAAGVLAGCLLAVLPLFAFYAVDARPYTLAALAAVTAWSTWTRPSTRRPVLHATITLALLVLAAYLQLFTVLVWPAFLLVAGRAHVRRSLVVLGAAAFGVVPLLAVALTQSGEIGWIPPASLANTGSVVLHVGGGVGIVLGVAAVAVILVRTKRIRRSPLTIAVLWWVLAPITLLAALDQVRPVLVARYALVSLPLAAAALGVVGARAFRQHRPATGLRVAVVATVVAAVVTSAGQGVRAFKYEDYPAAAAFAARAVPAGTPVLFSPASVRLGFGLYSPDRRLVDVALPGGVGADPLAVTELPTARVRSVLSASCAAVVVGDRVPTAGSGASDADAVTPAAVAGWDVVDTRSFGQVTVTVLADPMCSDPDANTTRTRAVA